MHHLLLCLSPVQCVRHPRAGLLTSGGVPAQFCQEIEPGNARAIECLEKHRDDPGFSPICKKDVDALLAARIKDFRLDPQLKRVCGLDIQVGTLWRCQGGG